MAHRSLHPLRLPFSPAAGPSAIVHHAGLRTGTCLSAETARSLLLLLRVRIAFDHPAIEAAPRL